MKRQIRMPKITKVFVRQYIIVTFGAVLSACAMVIFIRPAAIPMGGISGISLVLNYLFGLPVGTMILILNLPIFYLNYRFFGGDSLASTVYATTVQSILIDVLTPVIPAYDGEILLSLLFGGAVLGMGIGFVFSQNATMGGTDVIMKIISRRTGMSLGVLSLMLSGVIIVISAIIYGKIESALYGIVMQFAYSQVVDAILYGLNESIGIFIVTTRPKDVAESIMKSMERGVTAVPGTGMYSGQERAVLICTVRRSQAVVVKKCIGETDPEAFVMLTEVKEVMGRGFKHYG